MAKRIKLMADYDCWPLWGMEDDAIGNIDPATLPLTPETLDRLSRWAETFDSWLDRADPANSPPVSQADLDAFEREGRDLWSRLGEELGDGFEIHYLSQSRMRLLPPS